MSAFRLFHIGNSSRLLHWELKCKKKKVSITQFEAEKQQQKLSSGISGGEREAVQQRGVNERSLGVSALHANGKHSVFRFRRAASGRTHLRTLYLEGPKPNCCLHNHCGQKAGTLQRDSKAGVNLGENKIVGILGIHVNIPSLNTSCHRSSLRLFLTDHGGVLKAKHFILSVSPLLLRL
ncbi:hypothetical protein F2P81_021553 [Scophthalmus maximus]|uniref:Uncharacterized protein n=1 Tax=Scophthalmus maximus TaxID=52904 RepID=A0A6A4RVP1_SCOMX|nr:hypothetical protein F2P81_021553 [Scophthalmus maximus]